ncbi:MAG: HAD family hydrolase [Polyangiaceae bacterium]|nr:HAD family hydrolase [Polyangiaceae bacterium]
MPLVRPDALLLDAGGTLVFPDFDAMAAVAAACGHALDAALLAAALPAALRSYARAVTAGASHEDGWTLHMLALLGAAGLAEREARALVPRLRAEHDRLNLWRRVPTELPAALGRARVAGLALGVVSNSEGRLAELFAAVGLGTCFDVVVDSALEGVRKPDPEIFWRACRRLGVAPERCLYVGDIPEVDLLGARAAGIPAVLVDPHDLHPEHEGRVRSVAALVDALLGPER